ncbi:MAG: phosphopantetheine-binding protein [Gammaproteobacteria bacterium]
MTTLERLQEVMLKNFDLKPGALKPEARLEDLDIDSLGVIDLMFCVEDEFKITVSREQVELDTIQDVVTYIDHLIAEQEAAVPQEETAP